MRILLTNSPFQYYHTTAFFHPDWGALNLAQLAAMVDTEENQIKILDNWHFWFKSDEILKSIEEFEPDLVAVSNSTDGDTFSVGEVGAEIKKKYPEIVLIAGGQAATINYKYLLEKGFDFIALGEAEYTFKEFVERLSNKRGDFLDIKGLVFVKDGEIVQTVERPFLKNIDELPFPARKYQPKLKSIFFPGRYSSEIETARGCPYGCDFCSITTFFKRTLRKKSNDRILEELRDIKKNIGATQIYFIDDVFGVNAEEYKDLFRAMISEKLDIKWFTQIRPDTVANNPEMMDLAAQSGMFGALVGFESYDKDVLKGINKLGSGEINIKASEIMRKNNIVIFGVHMFGIPNQTEADFKQTYDYGRKYSDIFRMSKFSVIPGTPIFDRYEKEGKIKRYAEKQYAYTYGLVDKGEKDKKIARLYFYYLFRHTFSPFTFLDMLLTKDRLKRKMKWQGFIVNIRYGFYFILRKIGFKIL